MFPNKTKKNAQSRGRGKSMVIVKLVLQATPFVPVFRFNFFGTFDWSL